MRHIAFLFPWMLALLTAQGARAEGEAPQTVEDETAQEAEEERPDPMNRIGVGVDVGYALVVDRKTVAAVSTTGAGDEKKSVDPGLALGLTLFLGNGHGLAAQIKGFYWRTESEGVQINYAGVQLPLGGGWQMGDRGYGFIGLAPRIGAVYGDVEVGVHGGVMLPIQFTWYPIDLLGLVFEVAPGYGATARGSLDSTAAEASAVSGFLFNATVGVRIP